MLEIEKLKIAVGRKYGKKITNRPDCEELSNDIYRITKLLISYNTLRRFFGIAGRKYNSKVSSSSIEILSVYCGFNSFDEFCTQLESIDNLSNLYKLQLKISQSKKIEFLKVQDYLSQLEKNEHIFTLMSHITNTAFSRCDYNFLNQLFKIKQVFNGEDYLHAHLYFLIQSIGFQVRNNNDLAIKLWKNWSKDSTARYYYFELFVDMSMLVRSHYIGIQHYLKHSSSTQDIVFGNSLLVWRFLLLGEVGNACNQLSRIYLDVDLTKIHPIPAARLLNCKLLLSSIQNNEVSNEIIEEVAAAKDFFNTYTHPFFEHFICEGLVLSKCYNLALIYISDARAKTNFYESYYLRGSEERLKILEAYCRYKIGEIEYAIQLKREIDLETLDSFSKDYDSVFYFAIDKKACSKHNIIKIRELGFSHFFSML